MRDSLLFLLTAIHFMSMAGLALFGMHRIWLFYCWKKEGLEPPKTVTVSEDALPAVTVQVPLYNEPLVAGRIIDAVASFDWPPDKLEIQVLDDSDDETGKVVAERAAFWVSAGVDIRVFSRTTRTGYKAGALSHGMRRAEGEFIAIFDADFLPSPDFLKKTIPYFKNTSIGMVQARWGFLNAENSWLTRLQALLLSAHFGIEHTVRWRKGFFFNFNGTAGVWRKAAIESAGGWQSDTVTEDLDLSYRAQLAGWRFRYLHDVVVPSELPMNLADFRRQQDRWTKGAVQTARKLLPQVLAAPLPAAVKLETAAHLLANCCWVLGFLVTITLYPAMLNRIGIGLRQLVWIDLPLFLMTSGAVLFYYLGYGWKSGDKKGIGILAVLPAASIGLAPFFSAAVFKGMIQKGGVFSRTPKFGASGKRGRVPPSVSALQNGFRPVLVEMVLFIYMLAPVFFAWRQETWPAVPLLCLFPAGFFMMLFHDFREWIACRF